MNEPISNEPVWTEASGTTREEWDHELARLRYWNTLEDLETAGPMAGGGLVMLKYNPPPDIDGLSEEEAEVLLTPWRERVAAWYAEREGRYKLASPRPVADAPTDPVPVP